MTSQIEIARFTGAEWVVHVNSVLHPQENKETNDADSKSLG